MPITDLELLKDRLTSGALLAPSTSVPNIVDLARTLASLAGVEDLSLTPTSSRLAALIGPADHLVFVLADGLGTAFLEEQGAKSYLAGKIAAELRTVFPSASPVALTSFATGEWPAVHGVTGWWTYLPEIEAPGALLPFVTRSGGRALGLSTEQAFPAPALMARIPRDTASWFPAQIFDSVSSAYLTGGRPRHGYQSLAQAVEEIIARVASAPAPTYTYLYAPRVDQEAHQYGITRPETLGACQELDEAVRRLAAAVADRARVVVSADHGLIDIPAAAKHPLRFSGALAESLIRPPSGDSRVLYFDVREGADDRFTRVFRDRYRDRFLLLPVEEAVTLGLFGPKPLSKGVEARFGGVLALSDGPDVIEYVWKGSVTRALSSMANHSGLTPGRDAGAADTALIGTGLQEQSPPRSPGGPSSVAPMR